MTFVLFFFAQNAPKSTRRLLLCKRSTIKDLTPQNNQALQQTNFKGILYAPNHVNC